MRLLLGVDLGTQGTKAVLHSEDGACLAESFVRSQPRHPAPGAVEEDPADQLASVIATIRDCLARSGADPSSIAGLAIAGQMAGVIGIGADGMAVTPYDSWLDTRCSPYIEQMCRHKAAVLEKTGNAPSFNHGPKILWWKHERPEVYERIEVFVQPAAYVAMRLCGLTAAEAFIDPTYLHFSGFADNRAQRWDATLCQLFDVRLTKLPRIVSSESAVGAVTPAMATACGLRSGTPVLAGCGDTAASFLACGADEPGVCVDVAGTASVFAATTRDFMPDVSSGILGCGRSVITGLWHPYAYVNGGGQNLEWFRAAVLNQTRSFSELDAAAADDTNDAELPFFVPHLGGRVSPAWPHLRGAWVGLHWNVSEASLFRAMLEGVALEYAIYRDAARRLQDNFIVREIRITGGGEKSAAWNQLKADRLQARVVTIERGGGAPMGAALLAGLGTGVIPDLKAALPQWVAFGRSFAPNTATANLSQQRARRYADLLAALHQWTAATP